MKQRTTGRSRATDGAWRRPPYSPAGLDLFSGRLVPTTLAFISTDSTPEALPALSYDKFSAFARQQGYTRASQAVTAAASTTPIIA